MCDTRNRRSTHAAATWNSPSRHEYTIRDFQVSAFRETVSRASEKDALTEMINNVDIAGNAR